MGVGESGPVKGIQRRFDMNKWRDEAVFLSGATGFIGGHLYPRLMEEGLEVRCGTRSPERARIVRPGRQWVKFDIERPETVEKALTGCRSAFYLIHQMASGEGYRERERRGAQNFLRAAEAVGLKRIVYLGGVVPKGVESEHLGSRLQTGRILRGGKVSTIELRASMVIGAGSASWQVVRDLAARLPVMLLPEWTKSRTQPVYVDDVVEALFQAWRLETQEGSRWYGVPGPETLTMEEILLRTARLMGHKPHRWHVPVLSPTLSSYWLRLVTRADWNVARELVEGLTGDLVATGEDLWSVIDYGDRVGFDDAVRRALAQTGPETRLGRAYERFIGSVVNALLTS